MRVRVERHERAGADREQLFHTVSLIPAAPHAWAIEALTASMTQGAAPTGVATELAVLAAYAFALLAVSIVLLRRIIGQAG